MNPFIYNAQPGRVVFGAGALAHLAREITLLGAHRALVLIACLPAQLAAGTHPPVHMPAPPSSTEAARLFLEVEVNGQSTGELIEVLQRGPHYEVEAETLRRHVVYQTRAKRAIEKASKDAAKPILW